MAQFQPPSPEKKCDFEARPLKLKRRRLGLLTFALLVWGFVAATVWLWSYAVLPAADGAEKIQVYIPPQTGFRQIQKILVDEHLIKDDLRFTLLARLLGAAAQLKAGEYSLALSQSPYAILKELESGRTMLRALGFAEGFNLFQVADIVAQGGWGSREDFLTLMKDPAFIRELGVAAPSLEGYLFPETYFFERGESLKKIVKVMTRRMQKVVTDECLQAAKVDGFYFDCGADGLVDSGPAIEPKGKGRRLGFHQLLTLAAIVEKETGLAAERPLVAKVFLNRLRRGMKLQADPTVIYGLQKFGEPLTKNDLKTPTPFNTYTEKGLPQGPICNPGRASIAAVFKPSAEDYLYFVAESTGGHYFSKSLKDHTRAVARFRENRSPGKL